MLVCRSECEVEEVSLDFGFYMQDFDVHWRPIQADGIPKHMLRVGGGGKAKIQG